MNSSSPICALKRQWKNPSHIQLHIIEWRGFLEYTIIGFGFGHPLFGVNIVLTINNFANISFAGSWFGSYSAGDRSGDIPWVGIAEELVLFEFFSFWHLQLWVLVIWVNGVIFVGNTSVVFLIQQNLNNLRTYYFCIRHQKMRRFHVWFLLSFATFASMVYLFGMVDTVQLCHADLALGNEWVGGV